MLTPASNSLEEHPVSPSRKADELSKNAFERDADKVKSFATDHSEVEELDDGSGSTVNEQPDQDLIKQRLNPKGRQLQILSGQKIRTWW